MKLLIYVLSALLVISCVSQADSESNCQELDPSQLDTDPLLRDAFDQGVKWLFQQASDKFGISYSNIEVTKVTRICHWQVGNDIYNIFAMEATNNDDVDMQAVFTVDCKDDDSAPPRVIKWRYRIQYKANSGETSQAEVAGQDIEVEIEIEILTEEFELGEIEENVEANSESTCEEFDPSQLPTRPLLRVALDQGLKWLFQRASDKFGISYSDIEVTKINRICIWQVGNDVYNIFDLEATNNDGANMQAVFTVNCKDDDSAPPVVIKWDYHIQYETTSGETFQDETAGQETETARNIEVEIEVGVFEEE